MASCCGVDEVEKLGRNGLLLNLPDLLAVWLSADLRERYLQSWERGCETLREQIAHATGVDALLPRLDLAHRMEVLTMLRRLDGVLDLSRSYPSLMASVANLSNMVVPIDRAGVAPLEVLDRFAQREPVDPTLAVVAALRDDGDTER